jgi:hypothetical protein
VRDQPEDTAGHALEDAHPGVAGGGQNLEVVVEATEGEAVLGQCTFGPVEDPVGDGAGAVVDLIALGEPDDLFAVVGEVGGGNDAGVDNDVVDEGGPLSAGVLKPIDLNGGVAFGEDRGAAVLGVAVKIHGNFDTELSAEAGDFEARLSPHIEEAVERGGEALPHRGVPFGADGEGGDLEVVVVMQLEELGHEVARRRLVRGPCESGDPDLRSKRLGIEGTEAVRETGVRLPPQTGSFPVQPWVVDQ